MTASRRGAQPTAAPQITKDMCIVSTISSNRWEVLPWAAQQERSELALNQEILFLTKRLAILEGMHRCPSPANDLSRQ